jgi:CDP-paratose 2-epimerase
MRRRSGHRSVLIFGGAGFIGSNWAKHLLTRTNANVHIVDNLARSGAEHNLEWLRTVQGDSSRLKTTIGDIRDRRVVREAVRDATEIYHFAAQVAVTTSLEDPRADFEVNALGTLNILEAARLSCNRPFLLFTSTNKVYGALDMPRTNMGGQGVDESQPLDFYSPYGCSKGTADQYVHDYARIFGLPTVVFRMSCIAGPRQFGNEDQGWVSHFVYSALKDEVISIYGDGSQVRDVLSVSDLIHAFEAAESERHKTAGQVFNVGGGRGNAISLLDLISVLEHQLGKPVRYRFRAGRPGDQHIYITDFSKLSERVAWSPQMSVEQTIGSICAWWHEHSYLFEAQSVRAASVKAPVFPILPEVAS